MLHIFCFCSCWKDIYCVSLVLPSVHSYSVVLIRLLGPFSTLVPFEGLRKGHSAFLGIAWNKQKNKHHRLHHWHLLASWDSAPYNLHLKHPWSRVANKKQLKVPAFSLLSNGGFPRLCIRISPHSKYAISGFFLWSNLRNKCWYGAESAASGISWSKHKLGYFEAECFCGLWCHWNVAFTVSSFFYLFIFLFKILF